MIQNFNIPKRLLKRLAQYHYYLGQMKARNRDYVSTERLASDLELQIDEVREDLESLHDSLSVSDIHSVDNLLSIVEHYLGYDQANTAVIVGAGNLGQALFNFNGFSVYGLNILAMFDSNEEICGKKKEGIEIYPVAKLGELVRRLHIQMGIITTPPEAAQQVADIMIDNGVQGIWNFTQARIKVPEGVELKSTSLYTEYLSLVQRMLKKNEKT